MKNKYYIELTFGSAIIRCFSFRFSELVVCYTVNSFAQTLTLVDSLVRLEIRVLLFAMKLSLTFGFL